MHAHYFKFTKILSLQILHSILKLKHAYCVSGSSLSLPAGRTLREESVG